MASLKRLQTGLMPSVLLKDTPGVAIPSQSCTLWGPMAPTQKPTLNTLMCALSDRHCSCPLQYPKHLAASGHLMCCAPTALPKTPQI